MTLLSQKVIDQLIADTSLELLPTILTSFIQELEVKKTLVQQTTPDASSVHIRELAHSIKSCASTYGALQLQEIARQLEEAAANEQTDSYSAMLPQLNSLVDQTISVYQDYLAGLPSS